MAGGWKFGRGGLPLLVLSLGPVLTVGAAPSPSPRRVHVHEALEKLRPGVAGRPLPTSAVSMTVLRGECESFQLRVEPGPGDVTLQTRTPAASASSGGASLPVSWFREAYVRVATPSNSEGAAGLWPDPLIPLADSKGQALSLGPSRAEEPLLLWADVCAPATQAPGRYAGAATVSIGGKAETVTLDVDVSAAAIPASSSLPNSFGISLYNVAKGHALAAESEEAQELLHAYARMALEHRVSLHGMFIDPPKLRRDASNRATWDFRTYDEQMSRYFDGTALPSGARFTSEKVRDTREAKGDEETVAYYSAWQRHFRDKGWTPKLFFYAKDEPKPADYALVQKQASLARRAERLPTLVTASLAPGLEGAADIQTPVLNCFFPRSGASTCPQTARDIASLRQALGRDRHIWWYQSCQSHGCGGGPMANAKQEQAFTGWASYMVDHAGPRNRAMGSLAFLSGVDGELYFDTVAHYPKNPWQGVFAFGGNGDGTLFYPGTPDALKRFAGADTRTPHQPIGSIRLRHIRDGLEDYEMLRALEKAGQGQQARRWATELTPSGYQIAGQIPVWSKVRAEMTRSLVKLGGVNAPPAGNVSTGNR